MDALEWGTGLNHEYLCSFASIMIFIIWSLTQSRAIFKMILHRILMRLAGIGISCCEMVVSGDVDPRNGV